MYPVLDQEKKIERGGEEGRGGGGRVNLKASDRARENRNTSDGLL
jgi:hypothetical protein